MSYINKRTKLFMARPKKIIVPVRSEARMKNYFSSTDARAWCDIVEERRKHILEYAAKNKEGFCLDKFIPLETLFEVMMAARNDETKNLQKKIDCLEKCVDIYSKIELTDEQYRKLNNLKSENEKVYGKLECFQGIGKTLNCTLKTGERRDVGEYADAELENANNVQKLEKELLQCQDLQKDVDIYKNRCKMLDSALQEQDKMSKKLEQMKNLENELNELRKKAVRVEELEQELTHYSKSDRTTDIELSQTKARCDCLEKELQNVKIERDSLAKRIEFMKREIDNLKSKSKEAEILKLDRDRLQIKLNELSHMQVQYENLRLKCKCLESSANERDMYKQKYDETVYMECQCEMLRSQVDAARDITRERDSLFKQVGDLKSCICKQEKEIKTLVSEVDNLTRSKDETQSLMRDAFSTMSAKVKKTDCLISTSVQAELKKSRQGLSCDTTCYKTRIEELEGELDKARSENKNLRKQLRDTDVSIQGSKKQTQSEYELVAAMKCELEAAKAENKRLQQIANKMIALTGDEPVKKSFKQSGKCSDNCGVKHVLELGKSYKDWDQINYNKKRATCSQANEANKIKCFECKNASDSKSNEKLKKEVDDNLRKIEQFEKLVKQEQNDKCSCGTQKSNSQNLNRDAKCCKSLEKKLKK